MRDLIIVNNRYLPALQYRWCKIWNTELNGMSRLENENWLKVWK